MKRLRQFVRNCKSILCLDGHIGHIKEIQHNLPIIAADGAANKLFELNIIPDAIIGDLDSFDFNKLGANESNINIIHDPSQNITDFQKSMLYLEANSLLPAIILGVNGGYIDHIINNINIFIESGCVFIDNSVVGLTIFPNETKSFDLQKNTKISILGMPHCYITSIGLKWELNNDYLTFPGNTSCLNRNIRNKVTISVKDGAALVLIYLESVIDHGI